MEIIKINPQNPEIEIIQEAVNIIKQGGTIVCPTDTVYILGVDALRPDAIERLFKIKKRPLAKPAPIFIRDIEMAKKLAFIDRKREKFLAVVWPGPITVVLEKRSIVPDILTANKRTVGLRIADYLVIQLLMEQLNTPLTATSANLSGQSPLICAEEITRIFQKNYPRPDLILDAGCLAPSPASTVLDLTGSRPKILRVGPVSKKDRLKFLEM